MFRLCYISTSRQPISERLCEQILRASRKNNERDGITGLLIAGSNRFLQALEGEEGAVRTAYERIKQDPRHFACVLLAQESTQKREFPFWSMGFERSDEGRSGLSDAQFAATLVGQVSDPNLRAQFEGFLALQWRSDRAA